MSGGNNWGANGAAGLYGTYTTVGGGGGMLVSSARDSLDYARMGSPGRTPEAEYPDGFLGNPNSRRSDKLLENVNSLNQRSYTRGVHRGERIPPSDYVWPSDWNPQRGLKFQARGMRQTVEDDGPTPILPHNSTRLPSAVGNIVSSRMASMLPAWN